VYGRDKPEDKLLADCYRNSLELAEENEIESIAFPAISTGAFGYPVKKAAKVALTTIIDTIPELEKVKKIRFVLYGESDFEVHKETLEELT
jgi:O-acetyl-ADP-ribose deacetylase (regulator of RNase III)